MHTNMEGRMHARNMLCTRIVSLKSLQHTHTHTHIVQISECPSMRQKRMRMHTHRAEYAPAEFNSTVTFHWISLAHSRTARQTALPIYWQHRQRQRACIGSCRSRRSDKLLHQSHMHTLCVFRTNASESLSSRPPKFGGIVV